MGLFLSEVKTNIQNTVRTRQDKLNNHELSWFNEKMPWVRMTSLAEIEGDAELRKDWILFGGKIFNQNGAQRLRSGYSEIYNQSSNKPMPGITNVSIANKGSMGSTREANISFVCWDLEQLNYLELLYMTVGIHILLEWGWSKHINNNSIDYNLSLEQPQSDRDIIKRIIENVDNSEGHYDAMQGPVSNFSWNMNTNGGFDCQITIVSVAEMFLEVDVHSTSKNITKKLVETETDESETDAALEENMLATLINTQRIIDQDQLNYNGKKVGFTTKLDTDQDSDEIFHDRNKKKNYWVKWWFFEKIIVNKNLFPVIDINGRKVSSPRMDSDETLINFDPFIVSGDPSVCMLPFDTWGTQEIQFSASNIWYPASEFSKDVLPKDLSVSPIEDIHGKKFYLKDLLINLQFIYEVQKDTKTFNEFLRRILDGISDACGNFWDLNYQIDEDAPDVITVIDYKTVTSNSINPLVFSVNKKNSLLENLTLNTEVPEELKSLMMLGVNRGDQFSTKSETNTRPKTRSGAVGVNRVSTQKRDNNINKSNGVESNNEYNFYGKNVRNLAIDKYEQPEVSELDVGPENIDDFKAGIWTLEDYIDLINKNMSKIYLANFWGTEGITEENVSALKKALKKYVSDVIATDSSIQTRGAKGKNVPRTDARSASNITANTKEANKKSKTTPDKSFTLLPLKLSFTIDGISGLKFGNAIHIDYLPERYLTKAFFQITNISHTISGNKWTTDIETVMRTNLNSISPSIEVDNTYRRTQSETPVDDTIEEDQPTYETDAFNVYSSNTKYNKLNESRWNNLHPDIKPFVRAFINEVQDIYGITIWIAVDGHLRTFAQQKKLYNQGRTIPGKKVTNARPGRSYHNYGLAIDLYQITPKTTAGKLDNKVAQIGIKYGFDWGGEWEDKDLPHFQMTFNYSWQQLLQKYNKKDFIPGTKYVQL